MKLTVFYSWQSDSPRSTNFDLIQQAAQMAIERIVSSDELEFEPALDRDTQDVPGSPAIAEAILEKITRCGMFFCDVTIITASGAHRASPNPNVLIELGYAAAKVGWDRIICVMNEHHGGPSRLPFDLQHRHWPIKYRLAPSAPEEKILEERARLSETMEYAIRTALQSGVIAHTINPKDRRVAVNFSKALGAFVGPLAGFLHGAGYDQAMQVIGEDHENEPGSDYPPATLVEPILTVLSQTSFNISSGIMVGEKTLSCTENFARVLHETMRQCDRILDQYADRDEALISLVDEISDRVKILSQMLNLAATVPSFFDLYDNGIPKVHIDFFRYFLLAALKSYRVIRQFGVATE